MLAIRLTTPISPLFRPFSLRGGIKRAGASFGVIRRKHQTRGSPHLRAACKEQRGQIAANIFHDRLLACCCGVGRAIETGQTAFFGQLSE